MFPDPSTVRIVFDTMIEEELARHQPERRKPGRERPRSFPGIRRGTARVLVRIAERIMPTPLPDPEPAAA